MNKLQPNANKPYAKLANFFVFDGWIKIENEILMHTKFDPWFLETSGRVGSFSYEFITMILYHSLLTF